MSSEILRVLRAGARHVSGGKFETEKFMKTLSKTMCSPEYVA